MPLHLLVETNGIRRVGKLPTGGELPRPAEALVHQRYAGGNISTEENGGSQVSSGTDDPKRIFELLKHGDAFPQPAFSSLVFTANSGDRPGRVQRSASHRRGALTSRHRFFGPALALAEVAAHPPEVPERSDEPQLRLLVGDLARPLQRGPDV